MTKAQADTIQKILKNRPLLMMLREEDREKLIQHYMEQLDNYEGSNRG